MSGRGGWKGRRTRRREIKIIVITEIKITMMITTMIIITMITEIMIAMIMISMITMIAACVDIARLLSRCRRFLLAQANP